MPPKSSAPKGQRPKKKPAPKPAPKPAAKPPARKALKAPKLSGKKEAFGTCPTTKRVGGEFDITGQGCLPLVEMLRQMKIEERPRPMRRDTLDAPRTAAVPLPEKLFSAMQAGGAMRCRR